MPTLLHVSLPLRAASSSAACLRLISGATPARASPRLASCSHFISNSPTRRMASSYSGWEPEGPTVKTDIPGPKSKEAIAKLDKVFDTRALNMLTDYQKSAGNYIADPDGNILLDV